MATTQASRAYNRSQLLGPGPDRGSAQGSTCSNLALVKVAAVFAFLWCLVTDSAPLALATLTAVLVLMSYWNNRGALLMPAAIVGVFTPLRTFGAVLANDALAGPMTTAHFFVTPASRNAQLVTVFAVVFISNLWRPSPEAVRAFGRVPLLTAKRRLFAWMTLLLSSAAYYVRAGTVPLLLSDAESDRVSIQAGATYLLYGAYVPALLLCLDAGFRSARGEASRTSAVVLVLGCMALLIGAGSRLPAVVVMFAAVSAYMTMRAAVGRPSVRPLLFGTVVLSVIAPLVGAFRASYVGFSSGFAGVYEHFLRRAAADAGNTELLLRLNLSGIDARDVLARPFLVYLPGAQENLGQLLRRAVGLEFEGGGITVSLASEAHLVGEAQWWALPVVVGLLILAMSWHLGTRLTSLPKSRWTYATVAASVGLINIGPGGVGETSANALLPFFALTIALLWAADMLDPTGARRVTSRAGLDHEHRAD